MKKPSAFATLQVANFSSGAGSAISLLAIPWVLVEITGNAALIAGYFLFSQVCLMLLLPVFGPTVDSLNRKTIAIALQVGGLAVQLLAACSYMVWESYWILLFSAATILVLRGLDQVIRQSIAQTLVDKEQYRSANRKIEFVRQGITFASGIAAIPIYNFGGIVFVLCVDAFTFAFGGLCLLILPRLTLTAHLQSKIRLSQLARDSVDMMLSRPRASVLLAVSTIPTSAVAAMNVIYPDHFRTFLQESSAAYYLHNSVYAAAAMAMVILWGTRRFSAPDLRKVLYLPMSAFLLGIVLIATLPRLEATYAAIATFAMVAAFIRMSRSTYIMESFHDVEQGRANATVELSATLISVFLIACLGYLSKLVEVQYLWGVFFFIGGLGAVVLVMTPGAKLVATPSTGGGARRENDMLHEHETATGAARHVADALYQTLANQRQGGCIALGGGSTLKPVAQELAERLGAATDEPWTIDIFVTDDFVDSCHGSNFKMLQETFANVPGVTLHATEAVASMERIAGQIEFDFVVLGLGTDGHTAAVFSPDDIANPDRLLNTTCPKGTARRSLGLGAIATGRRIAILATGASKAEAVKRIFYGSPASAGVLARLPQVEIHVDSEAAQAVRRSQ